MTFHEALDYAKENPGVHLIGSNFNSPIAWVDNRLSYLRDATTARWEGLVITDCIYNCRFNPVLLPETRLKLLTDGIKKWEESTKNTIGEISYQLARGAGDNSKSLEGHRRGLQDCLGMIELIFTQAGIS